MRYFLRHRNERIGPFTFEELKNQRITKNTLVWYEGLCEWTKANEVLELLDLVTDSPDPGKKTIAQLLSELEQGVTKKREKSPFVFW